MKRLLLLTCFVALGACNPSNKSTTESRLDASQTKKGFGEVCTSESECSQSAPHCIAPISGKVCQGVLCYEYKGQQWCESENRNAPCLNDQDCTGCYTWPSFTCKNGKTCRNSAECAKIPGGVGGTCESRRTCSDLITVCTQDSDCSRFASFTCEYTSDQPKTCSDGSAMKPCLSNADCDATIAPYCGSKLAQGDHGRYFEQYRFCQDGLSNAICDLSDTAQCTTSATSCASGYYCSSTDGNVCSNNKNASCFSDSGCTNNGKCLPSLDYVFTCSPCPSTTTTCPENSCCQPMPIRAASIDQYVCSDGGHGSSCDKNQDAADHTNPQCNSTVAPYCYVPSYSAQKNLGICQDGRHGSGCNSNNDCSPYAPSCYSNQYSSACASASFGQACTISQGCASSAPFCLKGTCSTSSDGAQCSNSEDCDANSPFCVNHQCNNGSLGASCQTISDCTVSSDICKNNICQSAKAGDACSSDTFCPRDAPHCVNKKCYVGKFLDSCRTKEDCLPSAAFCAGANSCPNYSCGICGPGLTGYECFASDECASGKCNKKGTSTVGQCD